MSVPGSYEVDSGKGPQPEGQTRVRRSFALPKGNDLITSPAPHVLTIWDCMADALKKDPARKCIGWREEVAQHVEKKTVNGKEKEWKYFELSPYKWITVQEFHDRVTSLSCALTHYGFKPKDKFNIYATTAPNWQAMSFACQRISITVCTAYETLGKEGLLHSLNEPEVSALFTNHSLLPSLAEVINDTPTVRLVVYDGPRDLSSEPALQKALENIKSIKREDGHQLQVIHIEDLVEVGKQHPSEPVLPSAQDVACIMYTSGSTGSPKGVVLTHQNLLSAVGSIWTLVGHVLTGNDTVIAYLPLAHILAFVMELGFFWGGVGLGYARVKTLTDASVRNCNGDIKELRPTILVGVPAVWEQIRKGILAKVDSSPKLKRSVFYAALSAKNFARNWNLPFVGKFLDAAIFKAIKEGTGGRLKFGFSGGAAVSAETQIFISNTLMPLLQGFGLTESCGMSTFLTPEYFSPATIGTVGAPVPSIEILLKDHPEAGYHSTNPKPQGEILIRGPSVTSGYYKRPDVDKEAFTEDGWFRTGDIGQWNADGTLSIIDRLKNLVKLPGGEYIALEKLESSYKSCSLVSNICVHVESGAKQAIAIIFPHEHNLKSYINANNLPKFEYLEDIVNREDVRKAVLNEVNATGKKAGFKPMELLGGVVLSAEEWTPENGLVTPAQKIQRSNISKHFRQEIKNSTQSLMT